MGKYNGNRRSSNSPGLKYTLQHLLEQKLIGMIISKNELYYSKYEGAIYECTVRWADGTLSDLSEKYLEIVDGQA